MLKRHLKDAIPEDLNEAEASYDAEHPVPTAELSNTDKPMIERRQSSLALPTPDGVPRTPRTANRVRFEVQERTSDEGSPDRLAAEDRSWLEEEEDYVSHNSSNGGRRSTSQRAPLLTGIEAPSITVATTDFEFNVEDLLENARPKSGMGSAFMNMANSIMYACRPVPWEASLATG
ncbi:MAG: hypothetical protein Q9218_001541 [Villophora microphyllina]